MPGKCKQYSPEFKEEAARMVVDSFRSIAHVAREIGVHEITLGAWGKAYRNKNADAGPPLEMSERARLRELERRNRELEQETGLLEKVTTYFAREQR